MISGLHARQRPINDVLDLSIPTWTPQQEFAWFRAAMGGYPSMHTDGVNRARRRCRIGRIKPTPAAFEYFRNQPIDPSSIVETSHG